MNWYILTTAPGKEREAVDVLNRRGFVVQRPVEQVLTRGPGGKRRLTDISVTPRYVFHHCHHWPKIYALSQIHGRAGTRLVTGYLSADGRPAIIPDQIVEVLMAANTSGLTSIHKSLRPGDAVRVPSLHDTVGRLIDARSNLARVAIDMLGSLREVTIDVDKLEAA
jgi:transcription antitermination factor NusG